MRAVRVTVLVCVLGALCTVALSARKTLDKVKTTCPKFEHCSCNNTRRGAMARCFNISVSQIEADMARVGNSILGTVSLNNIAITDLPASWFSNQTIHDFFIKDCPLRNISETAIARVGNLRSIFFVNTKLQAFPTGLRGNANFKAIKITRNDIKVLKGAVSLPRLVILDLRHNNIEEVDGKFLHNFPQLTQVLLSKNKISHISPHLFKGSRRLTEVFLDNNRITSINAAFDGMTFLKGLLLDLNFITNIDELVSSRMPKLKYLGLEQNNIGVVTEFWQFQSRLKVNLRHNRITYVEPAAFRRLHELKRLDLSWNRISSLDESVFDRNAELEYLNLSGNRLNTVEGLFKNLRKITDLYLSSNRITEITDAFNGLTSLRKLSLRDNLLSHVPDNTFKDNAQLMEIDISRNNIVWVGRDAFRGLSTLTDLLLQRNELLSLNGSARHLFNVQHLNASMNSIQALEDGEFENNKFVRSIVLTQNNISRVEGAFKGTVRLRTLELTGNRIEVLQRADFPHRMPTRLNVALRQNPLMCDCRMAWLVRQGNNVSLRKTPTCQHPTWLQGMFLEKLTEKDLIAWQDGCAPGCRCECREEFVGRRAIVVDCSSAGLSWLPKVFPTGTTKLDLGSNKLEQLGSTLKTSAPQVQVLSLRNNRLSNLNLSSLPETVLSLDLSGNRMKTFPHALLEERSLTSLRLSGNPFRCDCSDYPFKHWVEMHQNVVVDAGRIICAKSSNALVSGKHFLALGRKQFCPQSLPKYVQYLLCVMVVLAVFLAFTATYLHFRRQLKMWLRTWGACRWLQDIVEEDADVEKLFDLFLCFSSRDAGWVHDQVIPGLDALGISYCTYERNFKGGFLLQDIIREAVACSRRTLLLLTRNFVASEWCRWEFRVAHQRALEDNINRLVIVLVDEVASGALDEDLRLYLQAANYIRWGEPNFWDKLRNSLSKREVKRKVITTR